MAELDKEVNCQRSRTVIVDDLDGSEEAETIRYSLDNNTYEIDLSSANAEKLRDFLKDYIEHSRIVEPDAAPGRMTRSRARRSSASGRSKQELADIREWAKTKNYQVSDRGRIKQSIIDEYDEEHGG